MTAGPRFPSQEDDHDDDDHDRTRNAAAARAEPSPRHELLENEPPPMYYPLNNSNPAADEEEAPLLNNHHRPIVLNNASNKGSTKPTVSSSSTNAAAAGPEVEESKLAAASSADLASFRRGIKRKFRFDMVPVGGDGNCLFRAVALQVYGDEEQHDQVRQDCLNFMEHDEEHFGEFIATANDAEVDETERKRRFAEYCRRKRVLGVHGNHTEIQALSELYNRPVEVYVLSAPSQSSGASGDGEDEEDGVELLNIFQAEYKTADAPIRLSYHDGNHYNAVIDPVRPTAGLGLGFSDIQVGLADKRQVQKAVVESDLQADVDRALEDSTLMLKRAQEKQLQRALKESSYKVDHHLHPSKLMALSDLDATNFELEQAVLASSLEAYRRPDEGSRKRRATPKRRREEQQHTPSSTSSAKSRSSESSRNSSPQTLLPMESTSHVAAIPAVAAPSAAQAAPMLPADEYPQTVQELVMNGFELRKVVHAYELIGDNFDDLLAFLMSSSF